MPYTLYVCLQDEDKIMAFTMEATTGQLTPHTAVPVAGGPSVLALSPDRQILYVGHRGLPAISSFRIDLATGRLTPQGTVASTHAPTFLAPDRTGRYLLSAYYQGGYAAVYPLGADGAVGAAPRCAAPAGRAGGSGPPGRPPPRRRCESAAGPRGHGAGGRERTDAAGPAPPRPGVR